VPGTLKPELLLENVLFVMVAVHPFILRIPVTAIVGKRAVDDSQRGPIGDGTGITVDFEGARAATRKRAVGHRQRPLMQLRTDYPDPAPRPGESIVKVSLAGICGTDLEITRG
jgi:hypothetical protein